MVNKNLIAVLMFGALTAYAQTPQEFIEQTEHIKTSYLEEFDLDDQEIADQVKAIEDLVAEVEQALEDDACTLPSKSQGFLAGQPESKKQLLAKIRTLRTQAKNLEQEYQRHIATITSNLEEQKALLQEETNALVAELEAGATLEQETLKQQLQKGLKEIQSQINALLN